MSISIKTQAQGDTMVVHLEGALDLDTADEVKQTIKGLLEKGHVRLHLRLETLKYIDSTGLGVLIGAHKRIRDREGKFVLTTNPRIQHILEETRLARIFEIQA